MLFGGSIRENILYGLPVDHPARLSSTQVVEAACLANAHHFIQGMRLAESSQSERRAICWAAAVTSCLAVLVL